MTETKQFIDNNQSFFFGKADAVETAKKDLEIFHQREILNSKIDRSGGPINGDIVIINGVVKFVSLDRFRESGTIQVCDSGSFHLFSDGGLDFSGTHNFGKIEISSLVNTTVTGSLNCWIFSGDAAGPGRRVNWKINVPVWEIAK